MHKVADFRSDKVTQPTEEMWQAMVKAELGNGVGDEGETVRQLQELAAHMTGKEAALFVVSGIMANQLAVNAQTNPGEEIILNEFSHIAMSEGGNASYLSGVQTRPLSNNGRVMELSEIERVLSTGYARTSLIALENTLYLGGKIIPLDYMEEVYNLAKRYGAKVYLDGARITNASVETGIPVSKYASYTDSIMFCLSKGLCAPAGSILAGSKDFIERVKKFRRKFGGGLKQAGPYAACGLVALNKMIPRLKEDHKRARFFRDKLLLISGTEEILDIEECETNMLCITLKQGNVDAFIESLAAQSVFASRIACGRIKFVFHKDIDEEDISRSINVIETVFSSIIVS